MPERSTITPRKIPSQGRAHFTVNAILQATAHILREESYDQLNTNRVAARAGVSIGSLYQYFPNKETLIAELRRQHFEEIRSEMEKAYRQAENLSFEAASRLLIEASIKAHQIDPALHRIISIQTPALDLSEDDNSERSARKLIERFFSVHRDSLRTDLDIPLAAHIAYRLVESVTHASVIDEPEILDNPRFVDELLRMLLVYVR